jgi:RNA polymerase sigma factor (TIGR02999 family)
VASNLTNLIEQVASGNQASRDALFAVAYPELRALAHARLYDGGRNTYLATTALVHESYMRFLNAGRLGLDDRRAFFSYSSKVMRSIIIDSVRERRAQRRGGDQARVTMQTNPIGALPAGESEILEIHDALLALEAEEPRLAKVVEMRYFGGFSVNEIAELLGLTERTVRRDWNKARLLLMTSLRH